MMILRPRGLVFMAMGFLLFLCMARPCPGENGHADHSTGWRHLEYRASAAGISVKVSIDMVSKIRLEPFMLSHRFGEFVKRLERFGPFASIPEKSSILYVKRTITGFLLPDVELDRVVWFMPETLEPVARLRWNSSRPDKIKFYRWEKGGVRRWKLVTDVAGSFRVKSSEFYQRPSSLQGCRHFYDPSQLVIMTGGYLSVFETARTSLCMFGKKHFQKIELRCEETENGLVCKVYDSTKDEEEPFSLLGLEGDITFYVDVHRMLPQEIGGSNALSQKIVLELDKVR